MKEENGKKRHETWGGLIGKEAMATPAAEVPLDPKRPEPRR